MNRNRRKYPICTYHAGVMILFPYATGPLCSFAPHKLTRKGTKCA